MLQSKLNEITNIENNMRNLSNHSVAWKELKKKMEIKEHELHLQKQQLALTKYYELQEEIKYLESNIGKI